MKNLARYLTLRNVMSWPVVLIMLVWIVFVNIVDSMTNGIGNNLESVLIVLSTLGLFYLILWICDVLYIRRIPRSNRWVALWITIVALAMGRGILYAVIWQRLDFTEELALWSRIFPSVTNLGLLMVFITMAYGMLTEASNNRHQVVESRARLIALRQESLENRAAHNKALLKRVRSRLAEALALDLLDTPENTVNTLKLSIDEVIRPLSRALSQRTLHTPNPISAGRKHIALGPYFRRLTDARELHVVPGLVFFALLVLMPLINILGTTVGLLVAVLLVLQLFATTFILKWLVVKIGGTAATWATPFILLCASGVGVLIFIALMPEQIRITFSLGVICVYFFCILVPVALRIAIEDARQSAAELARKNDELRWELARTNEVAQQQNRVIATALHGRLQAALAAAAFRLQLAIRDGGNTTQALEAARIEAEKAISFDVSMDEESPSLQETILEITNLWHGVCDIQFVSDKAVLISIDQDPVCSRLCAELFIELCTNAIKHGKATRIDISIAIKGTRVVIIEIRNNSFGLDATAAGYGTQLLDESCIEWSQKSVDGITTVRAQLPWDTGDE